MINKRSTFKRYEILAIRLNPLCDWSCDFITLQLSFFLDTSSNKRILFEIMILLIRKKQFILNGKLRRKPYIQLAKKPSKLNKKIRKKTMGETQLMKNLLNLMKNQGGKPIIYAMFCKYKNIL